MIKFMLWKLHGCFVKQLTVAHLCPRWFYWSGILQSIINCKNRIWNEMPQSCCSYWLLLLLLALLWALIKSEGAKRFNKGRQFNSCCGALLVFNIGRDKTYNSLMWGNICLQNFFHRNKKQLLIWYATSAIFKLDKMSNGTITEIRCLQVQKIEHLWRYITSLPDNFLIPCPKLLSL